MKLLLDQNLSHKLCRRLDDLFPGTSQVGLVGLARADDRSIWKYAEANDFVVVSLDADFAEMAAFNGPPPKVIWLRTGNMGTDATEELIRRHAAAILAFGSDTAACLEIY
jgi:predicted nuclease of predicted toxin-antitoxin system